jgi:hypothetical protein
MDQKIEQYLNNLVDECIKSDSFSGLAESEKSQKKDQISDIFSQIVMDTLLSYMSKDELDQLESINFESEEGVTKFAEIASKLPPYVFLEIGDKLRLEAEIIKKDGSIPQ